MVDPRQRILVSACLLGEPVRHDGGARALRHALLERWKRERRLVPFCPEVAAGLPVPREAAEIQGGTGLEVLEGGARVRTRSGRDVTEAFLRGARAGLELARAKGCRFALLKENSPSCGVRRVHDGGFSGNKIGGAGVTTALLTRAGIEVFSEREIARLNAALRAAEGDDAQ